MDAETIKKDVIEMVCDHTGTDEADCNMQSTWDDVNADDLDQVEIIMNLENRFMISIPDEIAETFKTIEDCVDYITRLILKTNK